MPRLDRSALATLLRARALPLALAGGASAATLAAFLAIYRGSPPPSVGPLRPEPTAVPLALPIDTPSPPTAPVAPSPEAPVAPPSAFAGSGGFAGIAEPPPTPPARTEPITYDVRAGDVLWEVAERFGLRSETLLWANDDLTNPDLLRVGQKLLIPPVDGVFYTVRPGERLADVATRYGVDLGAVAAANRLGSVDQVQAGVDIFLPGGRPMRPAVVGVPAEAAVAEAPRPAGGGDQQAALAIPPIPLPANIQALLTAGWLRAEQPTTLYRSADTDTRPLGTLPAGVRLERVEGFRLGRIQVRDPGDGRTRQAMTGWVSAMDVQVGRAPAPRELPLSYPAATAMDITQVFVPYRSQLDGTPYASANCGPATIGMALEAFGISVPSSVLRTQVLDAQRIWGNDVGSLITALADVVRARGLSVYGLRAADGSLRRWSLDDFRAELAQGRPVVVQVRYRSLPGRGAATFYGDHYILLTGVSGERFLYNDSIDSDGLGWDRAIPGAQLLTAMNASATPYAYTAFAVGR